MITLIQSVCLDQDIGMVEELPISLMFTSDFKKNNYEKYNIKNLKNE